MSLALNGSLALQGFEPSNAVKICNRMFDFHLGLQHLAPEKPVSITFYFLENETLSLTPNENFTVPTRWLPSVETWQLSTICAEGCEGWWLPDGHSLVVWVVYGSSSWISFWQPLTFFYITSFHAFSDSLMQDVLNDVQYVVWQYIPSIKIWTTTRATYVMPLHQGFAVLYLY